MHDIMSQMNQLLIARNRSVRWISMIAFAIVLMSGIAPTISHAAGLVICGSETGAEYNDAQQVNNSGGSAASLAQFNQSSCQFNQLVPEIIHIINFLIGMAGLVAVTWLIYLGLMMVINAGDGGKVKKLQGEMGSVVIGLIMIMLAFVFVNTVYNIFQIKINGASGFSFNPFNQ